MTTLSILTQNFDVPETSKTFLESYVNRVRNFISRNHLDSSLLEDLLERLAEKLTDASSNAEGITEKKVLAIVNSLGEPEDIFRDILDAKKTQDTPKLTKEDVKDFFKQEFHRNQKDGVVLGVCAGLGETFGINPIWIRLFFIVLTLAYGTSFIVYILLGILLPDSSRKNKVESQKAEPTEKRIERQANEFAQDLESRVSTYVGKNESRPTNIIGRFVSAIIRAIVALFRGIALLVAFVILACISIGFFGIGLAIIFGGAVVSNNLTLQSEQIFAYVPHWLPWIALGCGIALIVLSLMIGSRAIKKPVGNGWLAIACVIILAFSIFGGIRAGVLVMGNYQYVGEKTLQKATINTISGSILTVSELDNLSNNDFVIGDFSNLGSIEFSPSDDNILTIETTVSLRASDKTKAEELFSLVTPTNIKTESGSIIFSRASQDNYMKPTPFSFLQRNIKLSVPKNISIISNLYRYRLQNVNESNEGGLYSTSYCSDSAIIYSKDLNNFICLKKEESIPVEE